MSEQIIKTIENVDKLFSEIIVNGVSHKSQRFTAPAPHSNPSPQAQVQGEDVRAVELNNTLHNFSDPEAVESIQQIQQGLANEISQRSLADQALSSDIAIEANARQGADNVLQGSITAIESKIPAQASAQNQLADKNFVNSSIATNTANFLGTYTSMADIEAIQNPTNNDYVFLQTTDASGNNLFDRYKYNAEQEEWLFEYELNNSSFTAEQWATINSGLTQSSVTQEIEDAINALDVAQVGGSGKYVQSISQANGKITAVEATFASAFLDIAHPVGSLYWTSSSENPAVTFGGGTWKQIKDVFVWAKGDSDTVNATGGSKTVTLTVNQIPSHTHSVTASGTISVTTNPTFSGTEHSHTYTPAGKIASTSGGSDNKTANESAHTHGYSHTHKYTHTHGFTPSGTVSSHSHNQNIQGATTADYRAWVNDQRSGSSTGSVLTSGAFTSNTYSSKARVITDATQPSFTGSAGTTSSQSANVTTDQSATTTGAGSAHSHTAYFTGTQATLKATAGGSISGGAYKFTGSAVTSGGAGGGQAHDNMPPYVVKYCWERTA